MKAYFIMLLSLLIILVGCAGPENPEEPDDGRDEPSAPVDEPADPGDSPVSGDDNYVVYINLDGFAKYYYDEAVKRGGAKTLRGLIGEGVMFENLYNLPPSITNPNQAMIISGATSAKTQNVYRYFDKKTGTVVQQSRDNEAETLYDKAVQLGITVTSVRHFPAESVLSPTDSRRLYVTEGTGVVADAEVRFDQAIKIVKGEAFQNGSKTMRLAEVPRFLSIYCDDLDALGHNEVDNYGYKKANTEAGRMENVLDCLEKIDGKLAELIQAYKDRGIYEKTTFFLTTDHGMTPFGADSLTSALFSKYSRSKWPDLRDKLKSINSKFVFEYLGPGEKPSNSTTVVGVGTGLQMQLTFLNPITQAELENIKKELLKEDYIGEVYTREELLQEGYWSGANVDLLVVPAEKYHFHGRTNPSNLYYARGQHDSRLDSSSHIYGIIWGYKVKKLGVLETKTLAPQFGVAMAELLGFTLRDANVDRLDIFTKD